MVLCKNFLDYSCEISKQKTQFVAVGPGIHTNVRPSGSSACMLRSNPIIDHYNINVKIDASENMLTACSPITFEELLGKMSPGKRIYASVFFF